MSYSWAFAKWKGLVRRLSYKNENVEHDEFFAGNRLLSQEVDGPNTRKTIKKATIRRNRQQNKKITRNVK